MATTLEQNILEAQPREAGTKNHARRVRREGKIPAVVYGAGKDSLPISVDPRHVMRILNSETGHNTIFDLALSGGERSRCRGECTVARRQDNPITRCRASSPLTAMQGTSDGAGHRPALDTNALRLMTVPRLTQW